MNKITLKITLTLVAGVLLFSALPAIAISQPVANAVPDQYVNSNQNITLQGSGYNPDGGNVNYYWSCTGGYLSNNNIAQPVYTAPNIIQYNNQATYTCTLTVTNNYGLSNSDSAIIYVNYQSIPANPVNSLYFDKKVINLTSGNLNWSESVNANPSDILSFSITIQAPSNQELQNVYIKDVLPAKLIYKGNLTVNSSISYSGNTPVSGINIGTIPAGGITVIAYQVQVTESGNFNYGNTVLTSPVTMTTNQTGSQSDSISVYVNKYGTQGATIINTGLTNNILNDSFFIPLFVILLSAWLYFSGRVYRFADWLKIKMIK